MDACMERVSYCQKWNGSYATWWHVWRRNQRRGTPGQLLKYRIIELINALPVLFRDTGACGWEVWCGGHGVHLQLFPSAAEWAEKWAAGTLPRVHHRPAVHPQRLVPARRTADLRVHRGGRGGGGGGRGWWACGVCSEAHVTRQQA